jgi:glucosylceramidase
VRLLSASGFIVTVLALACTERPRAAALQPPLARAATTAAAEGTLVVTTSEAPFVPSALKPTAGAGVNASITVRADQRRQTITGFGGAFNEQGWEALGVLADAEREAALRALFDRETGLGFDYCRLPIGASDYAVDRYTLDESPGDYTMAHFSLARDEQRLIPYVKAAQRVRPDLEFWASAWTPPTWLKTPPGFDGGAFRDEPAAYAAYALYLARFVEGYGKQGIPISMLVPQNEPAERTHYPSCAWRPEQYVTFLRDHVGPLFKQRGLKTQLFVGTINREDWDVFSVLRDAGAAPYISGVALQWGGLAHAAPIHAARPELPIMQSETECGNKAWQPGADPARAGNDFAYAVHTWRKFRDFFRAGASSYMLWNMVLDEQGQNIDTHSPWAQNSAIFVDRRTKRVVYTPMFWATKHFSRGVARGAKLVASDSAYEDQLAFVNPDGSVVVELMNAGETSVSLNVVVGKQSRDVSLPPRSFATLSLPPA